jgi:multiple RNA-binding domain-containing protein 1
MTILFLIRFGSVATLLIPKSKSVALIDFVEPTDARAAFKGLSYRKYHNVPIYLEWAPTGIIDKKKAVLAKSQPLKAKGADEQSRSVSEKPQAAETKEAEDEETYSTLFVKNLNFKSDEESLRQHISALGIKGLRTVSITKKTKGDYLLSTGFGFAEFKSNEAAESAVRRLDGSVLDGHSLQVKPSEKRISKGSTNSAAGDKDKAKMVAKGAATMKLIVRNLAFQATEGELKALFSSFGAVKRVRIPKKMGGVHRGFGFIDFSTVQEASAAMAALTSAHLYGRHLVIEYARDEDEDLDFLRKRAKLDEGAIQFDKKRRKIDEVIDGGSAGVGADDM